MSGLGTLLREIHRIHRLIRDLREHLERLPLQHKAQKARTAKAEATLKEAQDALKRVKVSALEKESSLKSKTQQIDKYETQINLVASKKEYDALKLEIAHTKEACSRLEDEILAAMTETDERTAALPGVEKATQEIREDLKRFETQLPGKQRELNEELVKAQAKLKELEAELPSDIKPHYDRVVHSLGADALAPMRDRVCSSCSTGITPQQQTNLMMDKLGACTSCGRILYYAE